MIYNSMCILLNRNEIWLNKLDQLKEYIKEHNKLQSTHDKNPSIKQLGIWISTQNHNYKTKNK